MLPTAGENEKRGLLIKFSFFICGSYADGVCLWCALLYHAAASATVSGSR